MFPTDFQAANGLFGTSPAPWNSETNEHPLVPEPIEPVLSFSGSEVDDSAPKLTNSSSSGSDDRRPVVIDEMDERKRRRMISNRESARRSRKRKQQHSENLISLVNRHKSGNRELMNRLRFALHHGQFLGQENERLLSESAMLRQKLWDMHQAILDSQTPK